MTKLFWLAVLILMFPGLFAFYQLRTLAFGKIPVDPAPWSSIEDVVPIIGVNILIYALLFCLGSFCGYQWALAVFVTFWVVVLAWIWNCQPEPEDEE